MNETLLDLLDPYSLLFVAMIVLGVPSLWAAFRYWRPIASELGVSFVDRSAFRRVTLRGVQGGSDALQRKVKACRLLYAAVYAGFFALVLILQGVEGFILLFGCFLAVAVLSKPYDVEGGQV